MSYFQMTIETEGEYFFAMANVLTDPSSMIYIHQQQTTLCIHRLDETGFDTINVCAPKLQWMASGNVPNMAEQLYVCIYKVRNLLTITLKRSDLKINYYLIYILYELSYIQVSNSIVCNKLLSRCYFLGSDSAVS